MNKNKIIGIISVPLENENNKIDMKHCDNMSYLSNNHIQWLNRKGIQILIIPYNIDNHEYIFRRINALYFPSNAVSDFNPKEYYECCNKFIKLAIKSNKDGVYFPIYGICYGMEQMLVIADKNNDFTILEEFNSYNKYFQKLVLTNDGNKHSKLINYIRNKDNKFLNKMQNNDLLLHEHKMGISLERFNKSNNLKSFYWIVSINKDRDNKDFVSIIESKKYPFYGFQWHPEQHIDNFNNKEMYIFADFFLSEIDKTRFKSGIEDIKDNLNKIKLDCSEYSKGLYKKCIFVYKNNLKNNKLRYCNIPI